MQVAVCASKEEQKMLKAVTLDYCVRYNCYPVIDIFDNREMLMESMAVNRYSVIIVVVGKAKGLETIKHIHRRDKDAKILWFSDDKDFAGSAFEFGVTYFSLWPVSKETLEEGILQCNILNIDLNQCSVHLKTDLGCIPLGQNINHSVPTYFN